MILISLILLLLVSPINAGMLFNGAGGNNGVCVATNTVCDALTDDWILSVWFKTAVSNQTQTIFQKRRQVPFEYAHWTLSLTYYLGSFYVYTMLRDNTPVEWDTQSPSAVAYADNKWHHLFVYYNRTGTPSRPFVYEYIDNVLFYSTGCPNTFPTNMANSGALYMGQTENAGGVFLGSLSQLYSIGSSNFTYYRNETWRQRMIPDSNVRFYLPLWEGTGTNIRDYSGNTFTSKTFTTPIWYSEPPIMFLKE